MTVTYTQTFTIISPACCGVPFAMNDDMVQSRESNHKTWYCPNCGCRRHFAKLSREEQLERQLHYARELSESRAQQLKTADYQRRAAKANLTKYKKRVGKGVCPCCNRTFQNLARHMASQHPDQVEQ